MKDGGLEGESRAANSKDADGKQFLHK